MSLERKNFPVIGILAVDTIGKEKILFGIRCDLSTGSRVYLWWLMTQERFFFTFEVVIETAVSGGNHLFLACELTNSHTLGSVKVGF